VRVALVEELLEVEELRCEEPQPAASKTPSESSTRIRGTDAAFVHTNKPA
jgi:hypothetical protein